MNSIINYLVLATALLLSGIAAYYSVIGLAAIFPGSFWPIVVMGGALEVAKIVTASWLYRNWKTVPKLMRGYLVSAVVILVLLTSMGIFGFLSKAHIEQNVAGTATRFELQAVELQIDSEGRRIKNSQRALDNLDTVLEKIDAEKATAVRARQKKEREELQRDIKAASQSITELNSKAIPLKQQNEIAASHLGPIKYVTEVLYGKDSAEYQDKAVRAVIFAIIFVFDPLAILLIIAANIGFTGSIYKYQSLIRSGFKPKI